MRFGLIHRIMTDLLAILGILSLVTSGELGRPIEVLVVLGMAVAIAIPQKWQDKTFTQRLATFTPVLVLAAQVARLAWGAPLLECAVEFAIALQIIRLATRRGAAQDQQVIVLAWLHLIAGTVMGGGLGYAISFLGFLVVAPGALVLSHLRREVEGNYRQGARDRTGQPVDVPRILKSRRVVGKTFLALTCLLSVPIFLFTALLFVLFPRVGLSLWLLNRPSGGRMIGFSDHVDLGGVGTLRSDPAIVLRIEVPNLSENPPPRLNLYLKGTALDSYDGRAWNRSITSRQAAEQIGKMVLIERYPSPGHDQSMRMDLEPIEPTVIFLPSNAIGISVRPRGEPLLGAGIEILRGAEGEFRYSGLDQRGLAYEVYLADPKERRPNRIAERDRARYLQLPSQISPRLRSAAQSWVVGAATDEAKAMAVAEHLRSEYAYDLATPSGSAKDPLDHFLFESKRGHCEYFSTALAIMLRTVGVPTRNVTGFVGGTYNRFGKYYSVRQGDAHSWVEVHLEGTGWVRFDPTPPAGAQPLAEMQGFAATVRDVLEAVGRTWDRRVVRYDLQQQVWLLGGARTQVQLAEASFRMATKKIGGGAPVLLVLGFMIGGGVIGVLWWKRRLFIRRRDKQVGRVRVPRETKEATLIYEALDAAMASCGVPRPAGVPPLRHALALRASDHQMAKEVGQVTDSYLRARFGGEPLSTEEKKRLEELVKQVRVYRASLVKAEFPKTIEQGRSATLPKK